MIASGAIILIIGICMWIYGYDVRDSFEYGLSEFVGSDDFAYADALYYMGIILAIFGIVLLIAGISRIVSEKENSQPKTDTKICKKCGNSSDISNVFCPYCSEKNGR